jgi:NDP-sugar pyrophosphorylase family protein
MKAVILAGGYGTRLAPYTTILPKPLLPVGNKPILDIVLRQLALYGFKEINLAVGYLCELIMAYFGSGNKYGIKINYIKEEKPLGTAGALTLIKDLDQTFLLMNGDVLTALDYGKLIRFHRKNKAVATIAVCKRDIKMEFGIIEKDKSGELTDYIEKPTLEHFVSMGINILEPEVLDCLSPNKKCDFPDLIKLLAAQKKKVFCYANNDYWLDIGRPADYQKAIADFQQISKVLFKKRELIK